MSDGILTESCDPAGTCDDNQKQFKGVFMRYLMDLNDVTGGYGAFITRQADTIWASDRDGANNLGERWAGSSPNVFDWRTQASALSAVTAAVPSGGTTRSGR